MQAKKIGLILDLDHTLFDSNIRNRVVWIGGVERWLNLFTELSQLTAQRGFSLLFKIVTKKNCFDDLVGDAALKLRSFLSVDNPYLYRESNDGIECLVNHAGKKFYVNLDPSKPNRYDIPPDAHSHITITSFTVKSQPIIDFATTHGIAISNNILLDDTPEVLAEVASKGIHTVSAEKFYSYEGWFTRKLKEEVPVIFEEIAGELKRKISTIMDSVLSANAKCLAKPIVTPTLFQSPPQELGKKDEQTARDLSSATMASLTI